MQEVFTAQKEWCCEQQRTIEWLVAHIANEHRQKYGKSKVSDSQVRALIKKPSWDPKEWYGYIWMGSLDFEIEFEPNLADKEVVKAGPLMQMETQQDLLDGGVQVTQTYMPQELEEFLESYWQKSRESILA